MKGMDKKFIKHDLLNQSTRSSYDSSDKSVHYDSDDGSPVGKKDSPFKMYKSYNIIHEDDFEDELEEPNTF